MYGFYLPAVFHGCLEIIFYFPSLLLFQSPPYRSSHVTVTIHCQVHSFQGKMPRLQKYPVSEPRVGTFGSTDFYLAYLH